MLLDWKIRYLDRTDKQFKDRWRHLDTRSLEPVSRAAVEFVAENDSLSRQREILKYRHLFTEGAWPSTPDDFDRMKGFSLADYFEDEGGKEITFDEMAQILTGSPTARAIPRGARQHDIDYMLAEQKPIPLDEVSLTADKIRLLGYFVRDLNELLNSAFIKDGPASITCGSRNTLQTAVSDEEIRSFVMIFRRLYMPNEPANFLKAVEVLTKTLGDHPFSKWVEGTANEYKNRLATVPNIPPFFSLGSCAFTTKLLIDVFLYTQYAHQPDAKRQREFGECLAQLNGCRDTLTYLFLVQMWHCTLDIFNAGNRIAWWLKHYCDHHKVSPDVLNSLRDHHSGLGAAEKEKDRRARLFREKAEQLAAELWDRAGRPAGGPTQFFADARQQLAQLLPSSQ